ncbi:hypothetical protein TVAG_177410 [Trichomonas vaginalis G3]|uniref:Uncharacterized protein n=1 Tax=Trichomonas vaginalis (strain ATCC PRA-98 / G3) TaxID=412133 RepID=A2FMN3_TRIV3|nr:hypothetical protein TVAGG3_1002880 [Trichomonas vaginalis G3]EAX93833.1 hypothetical protein TVAG_177410 [Trichomonas vaginalis G3]KAI5490923.1 hypothetical protein TVAGG3_1002880 [Trichomonas vaginalis G3]|eukprot:XP_001306763.1 hypothetical protein [Trichomonas vaginalis G3]
MYSILQKLGAFSSIWTTATKKIAKVKSDAFAKEIGSIYECFDSLVVQIAQVHPERIFTFTMWTSRNRRRAR